ncbi:hypothetical protein CIHG_00008 [Coccidioides immitis H538.4]|uniref:Uncharacterized protein n=1 Tax=Coccidioides immitis H538.4 TaxID=396776 RepID=A0A0J8RBF8_COCIT|nr:hypothetical protein CIHG_00008 [Coccidioides immitis H538.4]
MAALAYELISDQDYKQNDWRTTPGHDDRFHARVHGGGREEQQLGVAGPSTLFRPCAISSLTEIEPLVTEYSYRVTPHTPLNCTSSCIPVHHQQGPDVTLAAKHKTCFRMATLRGQPHPSPVDATPAIE